MGNVRMLFFLHFATHFKTNNVARSYVKNLFFHTLSHSMGGID